MWDLPGDEGVEIVVKAVKLGMTYLGKKYASQPGQSVLSVGRKGKVPYQDFLQYSLSAPGVSTVIAGIGLIDKTNDPSRDQLAANLAARQVREPLSAGRRRQIEERVAALHGTDTNFFQRPSCGMLPPQSVKVERDSPRGPVKIVWTTAYAAGEPMARYEIYRRDQKIATIPYKPQLTEEPFAYTDAEAPAGDSGGIWYKVRAVDSSGPSQIRFR
jgi:hypothetical protein